MKDISVLAAGLGEVVMSVGMSVIMLIFIYKFIKDQLLD